MTSISARDDSGRYHVDGKALPSVTTIISSELEQPGLEAWKERTKNWRNVRDRSALVGTLAHRRILNEYATRDLPLEPVPPDADADVPVDVETACALWDDVKAELPIGDAPRVEETVYSLEPGYAGTADMLAGDAVIDLKTSRDVYPSHKLQLGAYAAATDADRGAVVTLDYRGPRAAVTWLDGDELDAHFEQFCELVEAFG